MTLPWMDPDGGLDNFTKQFIEALYEESWDVYDTTLIKHKTGQLKEDRGTYLPTPLEIYERLEDLKWLSFNGFPSRFICGVMQHETPGIDIVRKLTKVHGSKGAYERLVQFVPSTEYDREDSGWQST